MLRISKLTDYATVILARLAAEPERRFTAAQIASETHLAAPTVSKLLKQLHRRGLVQSTRGLHGGYLLARPAGQISAAAHPGCARGSGGADRMRRVSQSHCCIESSCLVGRAWQRVNLAIRRSLQEITLLELAGLSGSSGPSVGARSRLSRLRSAASRRAASSGSRYEHPRIIDALVNRSYRHGFVTDIEADTVPPGLDESVVRLISRKKREPQFLLDWRLRALRHWQRHARAALGTSALPADRLRRDLLLLGAQAERATGRRASPTSIRSCSRPTTSSACRCTSARAWPASRSTRYSTASRWPPRSRSAWRLPA